VAGSNLKEVPKIRHTPSLWKGFIIIFGWFLVRTVPEEVCRAIWVGVQKNIKRASDTPPSPVMFPEFASGFPLA
jgi:hypothetical protein